MKIIHGMHGLGDNIYQRSFIRAYQPTEQIYLRTPWPELYQDLPNVRFIRPETPLRTQNRNMARSKVRWHGNPGQPHITVRYGQRGIIRGMVDAFGHWPAPMNLPDFGIIEHTQPYVMVRPVTIRSEWRSESRNPLPEYVNEAAQMARMMGFRVVSVADLSPGAEWAVGDLPEADVTYHAGELSVAQLMALTRFAKAVIGGVGWIVPAAIATHTPAWIVCGGHGAYNAPEKLVDPRMNLDRIEFAVPDNFCRCSDSTHNCDKRISDHANKFAEWIGKLPYLVA